MSAFRQGGSPACRIVTYAPRNGMKVGQDACSPWRRASSQCPISCTKISRTTPIPHCQPPSSAYAAAEMKIEKNLTKTKPNLTASPPRKAIGAQIRRSSLRQSNPCGWIGS